jgi:hypothetical protein
MRVLVWLCIFYFAGVSYAQAQSPDFGARFFPPDNCVTGQDNVIVWRGPGTSTRCVQLPICAGDNARLQYDGANFLCVSDQPPCVGTTCPPPTNNTCPAQDVSWQVGISSCGASLPVGTNGQVVTVQSNNPLNSAGTAQYRCIAPGPLCPPGALCPAVMPHWELLDGATCQRTACPGPDCPPEPAGHTACPGPGCPDIRPDGSVSMQGSSVIGAAQP